MSGEAHAEVQDCEKCHNELESVECWNCGGEGLTDHDCGEDCCCCLYPEPNVRCDICEGAGFFRICTLCHPQDDL